MAIKKWEQVDGDHFRGLCQNEFWPVAGTGAGGCNVCVSPVFSVSQGICSCTAKERSFPRTLQVTIEAGPVPSDFLLTDTAYGDYSLTTVSHFISTEAVYDALKNQLVNLLPSPEPILNCNPSSPMKIIEVQSAVPGGFPGVFSWSVSAQFLGPAMNGLKKSWNGIFIFVTRRNWRKMLLSDPADWRYVIDSSRPAITWQYYLQGPFPRCESTFPPATGLASFVTSTFPNAFFVSVTGGT